MATVEWRAVLTVLVVSGVSAAGSTILVERLGLTPGQRSAVATVAWAAYFCLSIVIGSSYRDDPALSGVTFGLLGAAAAQLGELVRARCKRSAA